jgi:hypothetical protein
MTPTTMQSIDALGQRAANVAMQAAADYVKAQGARITDYDRAITLLRDTLRAATGADPGVHGRRLEEARARGTQRRCGEARDGALDHDHRPQRDAVPGGVAMTRYRIIQSTERGPMWFAGTAMGGFAQRWSDDARDAVVWDGKDAKARCERIARSISGRIAAAVEEVAV